MGFREIQAKILDFAKDYKMMDKVNEHDTTFKFTMWILDEMWKNDEDRAFGAQQFLEEHTEEFLNWYFFVREYKLSSTIAELYAQKLNNPEFTLEIARKLRKPICNLMEVLDVKIDGITCQIMNNGEKIFIRDSKAPSKVKLGMGVSAILMPYKSEYYASGAFLTVEEDGLKKLKAARYAQDELKSEIKAFIRYKSDKGTSSKTMHHYRNSLDGFVDFMDSQLIEGLSELKVKHIKGYLKSMKGSWFGYSSYARDNDITAIKQFYSYLYKKGTIKDDKFKYIVV